MSSQEVGTRGMPVLINVLKEDQADLEILHAALEALYTVCSPKKKTPDADDLGIMFTEIFVKVGSLARGRRGRVHANTSCAFVATVRMDATLSCCSNCWI